MISEVGRLFNLWSSTSTAEKTRLKRSCKMALASARPALDLKLVAQWSSMSSNPFVPRRVSAVHIVGAIILSLILTLLLLQGRNSQISRLNSIRRRSKKVLWFAHQGPIRKLLLSLLIAFAKWYTSQYTRAFASATFSKITFFAKSTLLQINGSPLKSIYQGLCICPPLTFSTLGYPALTSFEQKYSKCTKQCKQVSVREHK